MLNADPTTRRLAVWDYVRVEGPRNDVRREDNRWPLVPLARQLLVSNLAPDGVVRIEFTAAFPHIDGFGVWLGTTTDEEREALGDNPRYGDVRQALIDCGFTAEQLTDLVTTAPSHETVDRDYEGSWFYALR